jgi:uncharacterized protein (DUF488 family)
MVLFTVGHGAGRVEELIARLTAQRVTRLVDVRTAPASRKHPHFGKEALAASLSRAGIAYEWAPDLGGWRRPSKDSPHTALRSGAFRGYADHMATPAFRRALAHVLGRAEEGPTAVLCAESLWWRCHRSLLADAATVAGCEVRHILPDGRVEGHRLRPAARVVDGALVYDRPEGQATLLGDEAS